MKEQSYSGRIKGIPETRYIEKEKAVTNFYGNMMVEGRWEVLDHDESIDIITQSKIVLETEGGEKILDFLGDVSDEYIGKEVTIKTSYDEKENVHEIKHSLSGEKVKSLEGSLKIRYIPQIGYLGKGQFLFGNSCGGRMKRL
jgi:hypothetical protein